MNKNYAQIERQELRRPLGAEELEYARALAESPAQDASQFLQEHLSGVRPRQDWEVEALRCAAAVDPSSLRRSRGSRLAC